MDQVRSLLNENGQTQGMLADVNTKDERYQTPLHSAVFVGDISIARILIEKYAEINAEDEDGKTPLHLACMLGNLAMAKTIMQKAEC